MSSGRRHIGAIDVDQVLTIEVQPTIKVVLEGSGKSWSAYAPAVPGCISTGHSQAEVTRNIEEALTVHLADLHEQGVEEIDAMLKAEHV
jgi:predicted RNase H-like HicB family nuclease